MNEQILFLVNTFCLKKKYIYIYSADYCHRACTAMRGDSGLHPRGLEAEFPRACTRVRRCMHSIAQQIPILTPHPPPSPTPSVRSGAGSGGCFSLDIKQIYCARLMPFLDLCPGDIVGWIGCSSAREVGA